MNKLEELSKENKKNYQRYLRRMTKSMSFSSKGLIPMLVKNSMNVLDVGCGSGVMLKAINVQSPNAKLTGIDLNIDSINSLKNCENDWELYHMDFMDMENKQYDTIIFSSILHEISSYHTDLNLRFTEKPILEALKKTNALLEDNGIVIIRDGMLSSKEDRHKKRIISFKNDNDIRLLFRFQEDFRGFDNLDVDTKIKELDYNKYLVSEGFLKEFLCTYTWGEESFPREMNERFGILTKDEWMSLLKESGFKIETIVESKEEYEKYLSEKVSITDESGNPYEYPFMTIIFKAQKARSLNLD